MTNRMYAPVLAAVLALAAIACSNTKSASSPNPTGATSPITSTAQAHAQLVVREVVAGEFAKVRADFDTTMMAAGTEQRLRDGWAQFMSIYGSFMSQGTPEVVMRGSITVVNIPLVTEKGAAQERVSFDADGKIAGLLYFLRPGAPVP